MHACMSCELGVDCGGGLFAHARAGGGGSSAIVLAGNGTHSTGQQFRIL